MSETMVDAKKTRCRWSAKALQDVSSYLRQRHLVNLIDVQSARFVHDCLESSLICSQVASTLSNTTIQRNAVWMLSSSRIFLLNAPPSSDDERCLCFTFSKHQLQLSLLLWSMVKSIAVAKRSPHNSLNAMAADGINCEDRHCEATRLYTDYTEHNAKQQHLIGKPVATRVACKLLEYVTAKSGGDFEPHLSNTFATGCTFFLCLVLACQPE